MCCGFQLGIEDTPLPHRRMLRGLALYSPGAKQLRGLGDAIELTLGAITPDQAAQTAFPTSAIRSTAGFKQADYNNVLQAVQQGQIVGLNSCGGASAGGNLKLVQTASGLALSGLNVAAAAGIIGISTAALAPFTMGISALIGLFSVFLAHHSQAVAKEQQVECAAVPAANNYLKVIDQAVQSGQVTPQQGIQALQSLLSDFRNAEASVTKMSSSQCNAGCVWTRQLEAIVAYKSSEYQDLENVSSSPQAPATPAVPNSVNTPITPGSGSAGVTPSSYASFYSSGSVSNAPAGAVEMPSWIPIAAIAAIYLFLS